APEQTTPGHPRPAPGARGLRLRRSARGETFRSAWKRPSARMTGLAAAGSEQSPHSRSCIRAISVHSRRRTPTRLTRTASSRGSGPAGRAVAGECSQAVAHRPRPARHGPAGEARTGGPELVSLLAPMLCPRCETPVPAAPRSASAGALCPQCGALLAPAGLTRRLLAKVTQLARFG